ncbi:MAG: exo-beta-N-acetylmuramidase NamZ domain-containing protein [Dissulfurispiraceae bacterium]
MKTGLDLFEKKWPRKLLDARVGLLMHHASVNKRLESAAHLFKRFKKIELKSFFGPQHGIYGETQDNMIQWKGFRDPGTGLPVYSLYSDRRKPRAEMLNDIDVIAIDIQDIGSRYYTFIWTMELCMQACCEMKKSVIVLDRPNPLGGTLMEGPVLDIAFTSFVGNRPLPIRHGMTVGEIAQYLKNIYYPSVDLHVIAMEGWQRKMWFDQTGLPWVMPSPNMPTLDTAAVYPGMCLLEGTQLSEGRGTTRPFEMFGAPFIEPELLVTELRKHGLAGVIFRPMFFQPTFQKHAGNLCGGAQLHVVDREKFKSFKTGVAILKTVYSLYPQHPLWKQPPYEYETEKMPFDILAGTDRLRHDIENNEDIELMEAWWQGQCLTFNRNVRKRFLLYA